MKPATRDKLLRVGAKAIVAALAKGTVSTPAPIIERDTWSPLGFLAAEPFSVALAVLVLIGGFVLLYRRWNAVGRRIRRTTGNARRRWLRRRPTRRS